MDITTEKISIPVSDGSTMGGFLARPSAEGTYPAVIVYMEIFGVNSHIRDVTERVAREGYVAVAPDYFHRTGPGVEYAYDEQGMGKGMALMGQLKADEMIADANATLQALRSRSEFNGGKDPSLIDLNCDGVVNIQDATAFGNLFTTANGTTLEDADKP